MDSALVSKLVILHMSDLHSALQNIPKLGALASQIKLSQGEDSVITVDCGDHMDRMCAVTEGTMGEANIALMEQLGVELLTLGNNEGLTFSSKRLGELYAGASHLKVLAANMTASETGGRPQWINSHSIIERSGVRIGFIGVTVPYIRFYSLLGWSLEDPAAAVGREVEVLRGQVDAIVVLSHLGLQEDLKLAEKVDGIDLILGGHTHHVLETPLRCGSTWICGCGMSGHYLGEVELQFDTSSRKLLHVSGRLHHTGAVMNGDARLEELLDHYEAVSKRVLQEPAAELLEPLAVDWERDSVLGNLLASGLRKWTGAEVGLINSGQLLHSQLAGTMTKGALLELCPSPINPVKLLLRGEHLLEALEHSLSEAYTKLPIYGYGFRGKQLGGLCVDGLEVVWCPEETEGNRIRRVLVQGHPLELDREYIVATGGLFTFGIGYLSLRHGRQPQDYLPEFLRDVLKRELQEQESIQAAKRNRFKRSPLSNITL